MTRFTTSNALHWLDDDPRAANMIKTARSLIAAEKLIKNLVPVGLAKSLQVGQINGQDMLLIVPGPAHAARLNQINSRLIKQLNINGWDISRIVVRVNATKTRNETKTAYRKTNFLDKSSLSEFAKLEQNVAQEGPLADALRRLLEHHSNG